MTVHELNPEKKHRWHIRFPSNTPGVVLVEFPVRLSKAEAEHWAHRCTAGQVAE